MKGKGVRGGESQEGEKSLPEQEKLLRKE